MCVLSATQVLASAINKLGEKESISISQLVKYNEILLQRIDNYFDTIDFYDLFFEISSFANEFEIFINDNDEKVIKISDRAEFNYSLYKKTMPQGIASKIEAIDFSF